MTNSNTSRNERRRITVAASVEGIETAGRALVRLGFENQSNFATAALVSRSAVNKFFNGQPVQPTTLKDICGFLKLNWKEILDDADEPICTPINLEETTLSISQLVSTVQTTSRQVRVTESQNEVKLEITLQGDFSTISPKLHAILETLLKQYGGDTIQVTNIRPGSIRITIKGAKPDVVDLLEQVQSGNLGYVDGYPIESIQILSAELLEDALNSTSPSKWNLVKEIRDTRAKNHSLAGLDLSDADLSGVDLSGVDLSGTDLNGATLSDADLSEANLSEATLIGAILNRATLSDADLSEANLSQATLIGAILSRTTLSGADLIGANLLGANLIEARLSGANLSGANLSGANLSGANLSGLNLSEANLSGADLIGAVVESVLFEAARGISEESAKDLIQRGAIFRDAPGDRSEVPTGR